MNALLPVLELQYVDETGTKGAITVKYPLGTTVAVIDAQGSLLASLIAPMTGCALIRQRIIYKAVAEPRDEPDAGSLITRRGVFYFASDDDANVTLVEVPGIIDDVLLTEGNGAGVLIDLSNSDIVSLIATIIGTPITDPFGNVMGHILAAYRQSRVQ